MLILTSRARRTTLLAALTLALAGCGQPAVKAAAVQTSSESQKCLIDGAEMFEGLTENATTTAEDKLAADANSAVAKAAECEPYLSASQVSELEPALTSVKMFDADRNRTNLALSGVEAYRVLVSAQTRTAKDFPLEVALLDYAGFRYQAGAHATPPLWDDMKQAIDFADAQWRGIAPRVTDETVSKSFSADLDAMRSALKSSDAAAAMSAVAVELDHVDALEAYFSKP